MRTFFVAFLLSLAHAMTQAQATAQPSPSACTSLTQCQQALIHGQYDAIEAAYEGLNHPPNEVEVGLLWARTLFETGRYEDALAVLDGFDSSAPQRTARDTLRGELYLTRGRLEEAQRTLAQAGADPRAHRAHILLAQALARRGRQNEAQAPLMTLIHAYNTEAIGRQNAAGLTYVAMAAAMLNSPHDANDAFREAVSADPEFIQAQLEWSTLFLSHYDAGHAEEGIREALSVNEHSARAHALMARVRLEQGFNFPAARESLARAEAINPHLVLAKVTRAGIAIREMNLDRADALLDEALAIDPSDLEALSVRAAVAFLRDDRRRYQRAVRAVLRIHPRYAPLYSIIAEYADWEHRYPAIVEMAREALRLDPSDARAHATLGFNLLRTGQETEGLSALRDAWQRDRFNVRVYNTLNLYDNVLSRDYVQVDAAPLRFRLHRDEEAVMAPYMQRTLRGAWDRMVAHYRFTPEHPVHIEMFSDPEHFAIRTSGLPRIGVQGVCFGQVVTALSPRAGEFNWGEITSHELAHVFHLQLSDNHVPRWFTEGLAEYETMLARPEWRREEDHRLAHALEHDRVPPLGDLNHAFTHARSPQEITVAYYASTMAVQYIAERFGFPRIARMLRGWSRGWTTSEVVQRTLRVSLESLNEDFLSHTRERLATRTPQWTLNVDAYRDFNAISARAQAAPNDADAQAALAATQMIRREWNQAGQTAARALAQAPNHPLANFVRARAALSSGDLPQAQQHAQVLRSQENGSYELQLEIARAALRTEALAVAQTSLEEATQLDPDRHEAWQGLVRIAGQSEDRAFQIRALSRYASLNEHSRTTNAALLPLLRAEEDWDALLRFGEMSIYVDPLRAESRRLLGEAYVHAERMEDALVELDAALHLGDTETATVHRLRAQALHALNRSEEAREASAAAAAAEPSQPAPTPQREE